MIWLAILLAATAVTSTVAEVWRRLGGLRLP